MHGIAGVLALFGHGLVPTQPDEDMAVYRVVGATMLYQFMQSVRALTGSILGMKK